MDGGPQTFLCRVTGVDEEYGYGLPEPASSVPSCFAFSNGGGPHYPVGRPFWYPSIDRGSRETRPADTPPLAPVDSVCSGCEQINLRGVVVVASATSTVEWKEGPYKLSKRRYETRPYPEPEGSTWEGQWPRQHQWTPLRLPQPDWGRAELRWTVPPLSHQRLGMHR